MEFGAPQSSGTASGANLVSQTASFLASTLLWMLVTASIVTRYLAWKGCLLPGESCCMKQLWSIYPLKAMFCPQTVWPHRGVLTVTVKARCSIEVVSSVSGQFPVNFHTEFPRKMVLVKCSCAFRPRRPPQNKTSLPKDLLEGAYTEILLRDLLWRSC